MSSELLNPPLLPDFREDVPPVRCLLWRGGTEYETLLFEEEVYPFDTLEHIKRLLCHAKRGDARFLSKYLFVGIPVEEDQPPTATTEAHYLPLDYLWYPIGSDQLQDAYTLRHPVHTLSHPDTRFVAPDGSYASPNYESRSRTTLEKAFLYPRQGSIPTLHVFPFHLLYEAYRGVKPISEAEWNKKFAPYFPDLSSDTPSAPTPQDSVAALQVRRFVSYREHTLYQVNRILQEAPFLPTVTVKGILHMTLLWSSPPPAFEGCASLFYTLRVTAQRPYLRLLPADGTGITKLHVDGILPIPTLHDPRILEQWNKEMSPTPKMDFLSMKYVHRPAVLSTPPLYGALHVMNDGTMKLTLQPPKTISALHPQLDLLDMEGVLEGAFQGLPQKVEDYRLHDLSAVVSLKTSMTKPKFTRKRLLARLPTFQSFFREIKALPDQSPILSLRYKAVSQYVTENDVFAFITMWSTREELQEGELAPHRLIEALQMEFQYSVKEAQRVFTEWLKRKGQFVAEVPEEGEIADGYHPGVDLHIYAQHPTYVVHIHRMESEDTYRRIIRLLSILFVEDDGYFQGRQAEAQEMEAQEQRWDRQRLAQEDRKEEEVGAFDAEERDPIQAELEDLDWAMLNDPLAEMGPAAAPAAPAAPAAAPAAPAAPAAAPAPAPRRVMAPIPEAERRVQPYQWFIRRLQELDGNLFSPKASGKGDNKYSTRCQTVDDRQPVILTQEQYEDMRTVYEADEDLFWTVYPLQGDEDPSPPAGAERISVMRYGSDAHHIRYLFCPRFFCLLDEIMIRERDFLSDQDRQAQPKPRNSCPFCHGGLLTKEDRLKKAITGRTVVERKKTPSYEIGFLKPIASDEMALPCCFKKQETLRIQDPRFAHIRKQIQEMDVLELGPGPIEEEVEPQEAQEYYEAKMIEYGPLLQRLHKKYILEANKVPAAGFFAIPSRRFDAYFHQDSTRQLVDRVAIQLTIRPSGHGFLRVGVDNTENESLLGLLAPLMNSTSIIDVKEQLLALLPPRIFLHAHFGNLVLEFFDPTLTAFLPDTEQELMKWSETHLGIPMTSANSYALLRLYHSYHHFIYFLQNPKQRKELRHLQPLLAEPGLFTTNGIQMIVLEDQGEDQPVHVRCPIFGVSMERHKNNDVVFVSRTMRTMRTMGASEREYPHYELYVYTTNKVGRGGQMEEHRAVKAWKQAEYESWPEIVQQRVKEYMTQCQSTYRSLYTPQRDISSDTLLPLSSMVKGSTVRPEGVVKDYYNHLVAVTFRSRTSIPSMIYLPVIDDGVISISSSFSIKKIYLDVEDIRLAPVEEVVRYYQEVIQTQFSLYTGYVIQHVVRSAETQQVVALQLANGVYVPVAPPRSPDVLAAFRLPVVVIEQWESEMNKQMSGFARRGYRQGEPWDDWTHSASIEEGCGKDPSLEHRLSVRGLEELYQQFRVMVSRWLTSERAGAGLRGRMEDTLFRSDLPDYEKRKRLELLLSSTLLSWFYPDENWEMPTLSMMRKDCRVIPTEEGCTGTCRWRETETGGRCQLHVPRTTSLSERGDRSVDTTELFTKRMLDELVRFPSRRKQLLSRDGISTVTRLVAPIREDDQYILPETSATWLDLLRFDWMRSSTEEPRYYEEMSRPFTEEDQKEVEHLPAEWVERFGEDGALIVQWSDQPDTPFVPLMPFMGMTIADWDISPEKKELTLHDLQRFSKKTKRSVGLVEWTDAKYEEEDQADRGFATTFVKQKTEQEHVTLFLIIKGRIGLLMEGEQTYLSVESLPRELQERWRAAPAVIFMTRPKGMAAAPKPVLPHTTTAPATQKLLENVKEKEPHIVFRTARPRRVVHEAPAAPAAPEAPEASAAPAAPEASAAPAAPEVPEVPAAPAAPPAPAVPPAAPAAPAASVVFRTSRPRRVVRDVAAAPAAPAQAEQPPVEQPIQHIRMGRPRRVVRNQPVVPLPQAPAPEPELPRIIRTVRPRRVIRHPPPPQNMSSSSSSSSSTSTSTPAPAPAIQPAIPVQPPALIPARSLAPAPVPALIPAMRRPLRAAPPS